MPKRKNQQVSFTSTLEDFRSSLWGSHIPVPSTIANDFKERGIKRLICTLDEKLTIHCAIMSMGNDGYYILMNKANVRKLALTTGQQIEVCLEEDGSEFGMPVPEELQTLMAEDPAFEKHFMALTPGKQRNLLYLVGKPKSSEIRLRTAVVVAGHLEANKGKLDFRMLNEALKEK
ncbi:MAG: DUF1905 domain-containing protein [Saprospiraceae bacterium]|nr:DUF1905 domain-containing protein [Saprospiraceae bacterium]